MKRTVIRDKSGNPINIGGWDFMEEKLTDPDTLDVISVVQHNPLPEGATSAEEDIIILPDGGLAAAE